MERVCQRRATRRIEREGGTNLSHSLEVNGIPDFFSHRGEKPLVYLSNIETLAPCNVVMPLAPDFGLVCE